MKKNIIISSYRSKLSCLAKGKVEFINSGSYDITRERQTYERTIDRYTEVSTTHSIKANIK